ncbi:MAG: hypothetical protein ACKOCQ_05620 [Candidatus Nitrosotenuis sp.]
MDEPNPIKDLLYQTLDAIPQNTIAEKIQNDTKSLIKEIFAKSDIDSLDGDKTENYEKFAESLMHYILTNALIPSQRKITVNQTELDIVIPDIRTLKTTPNDAIVLVFPKTNNIKAIQQRLETISTFQPIPQNIWLVQKSSTGLPYKTYEIDNGTF